MAKVDVRCPRCGGTEVHRNGKSRTGEQRYICNASECSLKTFRLESHVISKKNTQTIERKNLTLRTKIKRLCWKTICFSKSEFMHDIVIGMVINIVEFGLDCQQFNPCRT